jgi:hypothetical protein
MSAFETANELVILNAGRLPVWALQSDADQTIIPATAGAGVGLDVASGDALKTLIVVRVRETPAYRTSYYTVTTVDLAATYTITINGGTALSYDAAAESATSVTDILEGLKAEIEADAGTHALVAVTVEAATTGDNARPARLKITDKTSTVHYVSAFDDTPGTGVVTVASDAVSCSVTPWAYPRNQRADATLEPLCWTRTTQALVAVTSDNLSLPVDTAGYERLYIRVSSLTGHASDAAAVNRTVNVFIGPCGLE